VNEVAVVIRHGNKFVLCQRPANASRWQNMWEVPRAELKPNEAASKAAVRIASELTGLKVTPGDQIATIRYTVTRFRYTMSCVTAKVSRGRLVRGDYAETRWVNLSELPRYPLSSPQRRLIAVLDNQHMHDRNR
jgi:A/G-specific adenine glycosylase